MEKHKIFLASSSELKEDRDQFEILLSRKNKEWIDKGLFQELDRWENFLDAMSQTRLQNEYNNTIKSCDIFVALFYTRAGQYTQEEFETAFGQFIQTKKPFIFTYFKQPAQNFEREDSLIAFQKKLIDLGHFYTLYNNIEGLIYHFNNQLDKLFKTRFEELVIRKDQLIQTADKIYNIENINTATFN